jgi:hypothetical protein
MAPEFLLRRRVAAADLRWPPERALRQDSKPRLGVDDDGDPPAGGMMRITKIENGHWNIVSTRLSPSGESARPGEGEPADYLSAHCGHRQRPSGVIHEPGRLVMRESSRAVAASQLHLTGEAGPDPVRPA